MKSKIVGVRQSKFCKCPDHSFEREGVNRDILFDVVNRDRDFDVVNRDIVFDFVNSFPSKRFPIDK